MRSLESFDDQCPAPEVLFKEATVALSPSRLPGLDLALNPYTRCGHDCTYCYAPYIMRVSPGEWGRGVVAKANLPKLLEKELPRKKGVIGLGTVTDPYQPAEARLGLTRRCLEVLCRHGAKVSVLTKSALVDRDADLLSRMPSSEVGLTVTSISDERASIFEPCASPPSRRLRAVRALRDAGVSVYVFLGPVVPTVTDTDLEALVGAIADAGARMVMADRLNLRPGMQARMVEVMARKSPGSVDEFIREVSSPDYYARTLDKIRQLATARGIEYRDAF